MASWFVGAGGGARMRRKYYYFYSGGSIYTLSTPKARRGRGCRRMGQYMKKPKRVQKMEVSQSSGVVGVRTRARTRALEKQTGLKCAVAADGSSSKRSNKQTEIEPHYMELRSRRIVKPASFKDAVQRSPSAANKILVSSSRPPFESHQFDADLSVPSHRAAQEMHYPQHDEDSSEVPPRNSCSSRPNNFSGIAQLLSSLQTLENRSSEQINLAGQPACTERLQGKRTDLGNSDMESDRVPLGDAGPSRDVQTSLQRETEVVTSCFVGSPTLAGHAMQESFPRECTPDSLIRDADPPASISRPHGYLQMRSFSAPPLSRSSELISSSEIEAFFSSAEQRERKRFIERYNFDPLTEKPLKGRYLWMK